MKLNKIEVARRQLITAIDLLFKDQDQDQVSIHTLVSASHQILYDIAKQQGIKSFLDFVKPEKQKQFQKRVREARNFFKHADQDSDENFEFNPTQNAYIFADAIYVYEQLSSEYIWEFKAFSYWFYCNYPELLTSSIENLKSQFQSAMGTSDPIRIYNYFLDNREFIEQNKDLLRNLLINQGKKYPSILGSSTTQIGSL